MWRRERNNLLGCVEWTEHRADAARFFGGCPIALAFLAQRTGTAMTDAGGIDHAHAAIAFKTAFLRIQGKTSRTLYGAVWLGGEVFARDASHARDGPHRRLVGNVCLGCTAWFYYRLGLNGCEFGRAHRRGMECMAEGEAQVPDPLRENEPKLLAPSGMRTPAVRLLFLVFIRQHRLKSATMHVQGDHISRSERSWWQGGVEQLIDALTTYGADLHRRFGRRTCGDDDSCAWSRWRKSESREVKEGPRGSRFGMGGLLIRGGLAPLADRGDHSPCPA